MQRGGDIFECRIVCRIKSPHERSFPLTYSLSTRGTKCSVIKMSSNEVTILKRFSHGWLNFVQPSSFSPGLISRWNGIYDEGYAILAPRYRHERGEKEFAAKSIGIRGGRGGRASEKTGGLLSVGVYTSRIGVLQQIRTYLRTFIVYELQFRDGSRLIQFNGVPGELYARRHLVPRSVGKYEYVYASMMWMRVCVRAHTQALEMYIGSKGEGEGALVLGVLNDNGDNNNLI